MRKLLGASLLLLLLSDAIVRSAIAGDKNRKQVMTAKPQETESYLPFPVVHQKKNTRALLQSERFDEAIYSENFDSGAPDWKFQDLWSESFWHPSTTGAFAGKSYWCGLKAMGGYDDYWVQSLTSPAITLPNSQSLTLTFMQSYNIEPSGGTPEGYDAWDAVTVRLSTDGEIFNVITPVGGYRAQSTYGFHLRYGAGVAGWAGNMSEWTPATFDLSSFAGRTVWVRFELGADESFSHADDPSLFGWRVDDIKVLNNANVIFSDDAGDTGAAKFLAEGPGGPNLWHISNAASASAPNSAACFNQTSGNYLPGAKTALVSPAIQIKSLPANTRQLLADFKLQGVLDPSVYAGSGLNNDFFMVEVRAYSNSVWSYWDTPADMVGTLPLTFASYNASYPSDLDMSSFIGSADSLQFRFTLMTQPDSAVVSPANLFVDDFTLTALTTSMNDVSTIDLDVPFPNLVLFGTQTGVARIANLGMNNQSTVFVRHRVNDGPAMLPNPPNPLSLASGAQASSIFNWSTPAPGNYSLMAMTTLEQDENSTNDTLGVSPIVVYPEGMAELGYDDRFMQEQFLTTATGLVNFSVLSDLRGAANTYDLRRVKVDLLNASTTESDQVRIIVASASDDTTIVDVLLDVVEPLPPNDFSAHFFEVNAFNLTAPRFLVLVDFSVSKGNARMVMDGRTRFVGHNFFFDGKSWAGSSFGRQIRAWVTWLAAPDIIAVRDVPNDQGKQAHVSWFPSPNESFNNEVSHYVLWRAVKAFNAASATGYRVIKAPSMAALYDYGIRHGQKGDRVAVADSTAWDYIASVPSHPGFEVYSYVAPTLTDSNATGRNYTTFMVSAYDIFSRFVDSKVDSGFSVDNIAPVAPAGFVASNPATGVRLSWKANREEDLAYYAIYKGMRAEPIVRTVDSSYVDTNVSEGVTYSYRITAFDVNGNQSINTPAAVIVGVAGSRVDAIPAEYALSYNYPNPFNPRTTITFELPEQGIVKLTILNAMGQEIVTLLDKRLQAGYYSVVWEAKDQASGIYFCRFTGKNFSQLKKMLLAK